jgi:glycosyltransferase involved in cell wall biosynthesis
VSAPKISVVMPVKRADPAHLRESIDGVLNQTMSDLELIVVEDPSERSARDLVTGIADPRLTYVENRQPTSHADQINTAIRTSRSEWIAHMDADDVAEPRRLELQVNALAAHPEVDVLGTALTIIAPSGEVTGVRNYPPTHEQIVRTLRRYNAVAHSTAVYRKQIVVDAGGYEERVYPAIDYSLWARVARAGGRFMNLPDRLVRYRLHAGELKALRLKDTIRASRWIKKEYLAGELTLRDRLRLIGEAALLVLPDDVVLRLFKAVQYERP